VRDNIMPLPYKEPSQTLLALLNQITEEGRRLGAISDMNISDMSAQAPVGTTLALLERTLKTMSAVQARVHASLRMEFKLLKKIIEENTPEEYTYDPTNAGRRAKQSDYATSEVIPVSDPNAATMAQRIMQYQAAIQLAQGAPQIYDLPELHRQMLEVLGIKNIDKLIPGNEDQKPRDPISENMSFLTGKPTKAFITQDHDAHIATHMALMQDPTVMQLIGQSPMAQQMQGSVMAHIAEHLAFNYRAKVEQQLGVPLPPPDANLDPKVEAQLSQLIAQASQQLLQSNQQQAQQQQAQQQAQDPNMQMQMKELQLKEQELARKKEQSDREFDLSQQKLQIERDRIAIDAKKEGARLQSQERQGDKRIQADIAKAGMKSQQINRTPNAGPNGRT
jgi:hypothetical protein